MKFYYSFIHLYGWKDEITNYMGGKMKFFLKTITFPMYYYSMLIIHWKLSSKFPKVILLNWVCLRSFLLMTSINTRKCFISYYNETTFFYFTSNVNTIFLKSLVKISLLLFINGIKRYPHFPPTHLRDFFIFSVRYIFLYHIYCF